MKPQASTDAVIALDTADLSQALAWADRLVAIRPERTVFKVGLELFSAHGPQAVRELRARGARVFLDLKLHDIPNTVAKATEAARALGAEFLTLHAAGGRAMWGAASQVRGEMQLLAVTVLTSFDDHAWQEASLGGDSVADTVLAWARATKVWGSTGWVCSARELALLPEHGYRMVPGIRLPGAAAQDQARVATPVEAAQAGATGLVLGRSLLGTPDPAATLRAIFADLDALGEGA